jgi:hypothetical protein
MSSPVFDRITFGIRKPVVRFTLASGRRIELVAFHLEPAWSAAQSGDGLPQLAEVARHLCPNDKATIVPPRAGSAAAAFACVADLQSDEPTRRDGIANCSSMVLVGLIERIDAGVRGMVSELLSQVDWDANATDDTWW